MPEEMTKLRNALDVRNIPWEDTTTNMDREFPFLDMNIYGTNFNVHGRRYEVISGFSTLGGQWGLLELKVNFSEPKGSLTAEGVLTILDGEESCLI